MTDTVFERGALGRLSKEELITAVLTARQIAGYDWNFLEAQADSIREHAQRVIDLQQQLQAEQKRRIASDRERGQLYVENQVGRVKP
jgi:hypothetical protein